MGAWAAFLPKTVSKIYARWIFRRGRIYAASTVIWQYHLLCILKIFQKHGFRHEKKRYVLVRRR